MIIFFIRHGLTDWNIQRRFQGTMDTALNDAGVAQANAVAVRCKTLSLERVYHSTLLRAAETARIIADASSSPLFPHPGLNEVCLGVFQGLNHEEARMRYPEAYTRYFADRIHGAPPQGESLYELQQRALCSLDKIERDAASCERIAIVSHGAWLKALLGGIANIPLECFAGFDVSNCSISVVESKAGNRKLITLNDMAHFGDFYEEMEKTKLLI